MAVVKNLMVRSGADFSALYKETKKAQQQLSGFKNSISKTMKGIGAVLVTVGFGKIIKDSINAASELEGAMMGLQSIVEGQGRSFGKANAFINEYIKDGLVPLTDAVTAYKNLAARGYDDEQIKNVMERLKDSAAFGRQASYSLGEAVKTATEGLKNENSILVDNAGVTKNVSKMWEDYAKSIGTTRDKLTQQQKIQAEVNGIMQETQFQVGDAAKYTDTYAGRLAAFNKTIFDVRVNLGQAFMPISNIVLPLLQTLANALARTTAFIAQFMQALFGKAAPKTQAKAIQQQTAAVEGLEKAYGGTGKAVKKADKEAKGALAGFDEINQLSMGTDGASGADGGAGSGGAGAEGIGDLALETPDYGDVLGGVAEVSEKTREMANKVRQSFKDLADFLKQNKDYVVSAIAGIVSAFAGFAIISNWSAIVASLSTAFTGLSAGIAAISWPIIAVAAAIGVFVANLIHLWRTNDKFRESVIEVWIKIKTFVTKVVGDMWGIVKSIWDKYGQTLINNLLGFMGTIQAAIVKVWDGFLKPLITNALEMLSWLWDKHLKGLVTVFGEVIMKLINGALEIWNGFIAPIIGYLVEELGPAFAVFFSYVTDKFGTFVAMIADVAKGVLEILGGIIDFIVGVFTGNWKKAWEGVQGIFKGIFDTLAGFVKFPLNKIIDMVNMAIRGVNVLIKSINKVPGMNIPIVPTMPKLAKGGITNGPMAAIVGDNPGGREVISPLDDLKDIVASAVGTAILSAQQFNGNSKQGDVIIQLDGTTLARVLNPYSNKEKSRIGGTMITTA